MLHDQDKQKMTNRERNTLIRQYIVYINKMHQQYWKYIHVSLYILIFKIKG